MSIGFCHTGRKSFPASSVPAAFFCKQKNKHLTPAIFGGVPFSWRATREANEQFQKHANFHYTAENRLATSCQPYSFSWLTIWKANGAFSKSKFRPMTQGRTYTPPCRRYNTLHFASKAVWCDKCRTPAPSKGTPCPLLDTEMRHNPTTICCT
jgi:hypothetical protein